MYNKNKNNNDNIELSAYGDVNGVGYILRCEAFIYVSSMLLLC